MRGRKTGGHARACGRGDVVALRVREAQGVARGDRWSRRGSQRAEHGRSPAPRGRAAGTVAGTGGTRRSLNNPALHAFQSQGC